MTISTQTDFAAHETPLERTAPEIRADWVATTMPDNDRAPQEKSATNIVAFKPRWGEEGQSRPQLASTSAPNVPECVRAADRVAAYLMPHPRRPLTAPLLIAASLLCHALALAYFADHAPPTIAIGEKPVLAELVTGQNTASGFNGEMARDSIATPAMQQADSSPSRIEPQSQSILPEEAVPPASAPKEAPAIQVALADRADDAAKPLPRRTEPKVSAQAENPRHVARKKQDNSHRAALASPASAAASQAARETAAASATNYAGQVARHLQRFKRFPDEARARGVSGVASVAFQVNGAGQASAIRLVSSSGHAVLDQEVRTMVQRASPFPPPPDGKTVSFTLPVGFRSR